MKVSQRKTLSLSGVHSQVQHQAKIRFINQNRANGAAMLIKNNQNLSFENVTKNK